MDRKYIGAFIRARRKEKRLTQKQLGELIGVSDRAVSRWENGIGLPDVEILLPLSKSLGVTVDELLTGEECKAAPIARSGHKSRYEASKALSTVKVLAMCLAGVLTVILSIFYADKSHVKYTDGFFSLVEKNGEYYPYFNLSEKTVNNIRIDTSSISPHETSTAYELYGKQWGFAPGTCVRQFASFSDMTRNTGIIMDPVTSGFSESRCMVYVDDYQETAKTLNVVTGDRSNGRNVPVFARFTYITSHSGDLFLLSDDILTGVNKPSVRRLKCTNGDLYYIITSKDQDQIMAYYYSGRNGYICTFNFDTSDVNKVNKYISSIYT